MDTRKNIMGNETIEIFEEISVQDDLQYVFGYRFMYFCVFIEIR